MADGEDWLMSPVLAGMIKYESLRDGTLDLNDVAICVDALEVRAENERRQMEARSGER